MLLLPLEFYDTATMREMKLDYWSGKEGGDPWLFYKHPDGQWVSVRKPTTADIEKLEAM